MITTIRDVYSSLAYLKRLPIDYVKIVQSFIFDMMTDDEEKRLTDTIVSIAQQLRLNRRKLFHLFILIHNSNIYTYQSNYLNDDPYLNKLLYLLDIIPAYFTQHSRL